MLPSLYHLRYLELQELTAVATVHLFTNLVHQMIRVKYSFYPSFIIKYLEQFTYICNS